jgi:hypothetical protein
MRRFVALLFCAALAVVPAFVGLMGNQSFSHAVEVRVPPHVAAGGRARVEAVVQAAPVPSRPVPAHPGTDAASKSTESAQRAQGKAGTRSRSGSSNAAGEDRRSSSDSRTHHLEVASGRDRSGTTGRADDRGAGLQPRDDRGVRPQPRDDSGGSRSGSGSSAGSGRHGSGSTDDAVKP